MATSNPRGLRSAGDAALALFETLDTVHRMGESGAQLGYAAETGSVGWLTRRSGPLPASWRNAVLKFFRDLRGQRATILKVLGELRKVSRPVQCGNVVEPSACDTLLKLSSILANVARIVTKGELDDESCYRALADAIKKMGYGPAEWNGLRAAIVSEFYRAADRRGARQAVSTDQENATARTEKPKWDAVTEARNKWIYKQCCKVVSYKTIVTELKRLGPTKGWEPITSNQGVYRAAKRYAERHKVDPPPMRQGGRKPKRAAR